MNATNKQQKTRKLKRRTPDEQARYLIQGYLNDCGGADDGFVWTEDEEALRVAIARAIREGKRK